MGKKRGWFSAVRKALGPPDSNKKKDKRFHKSSSKKPWVGNQRSLDTDLSQTEAELTNPPHDYPPIEEAKLAEPDDEQSKQAYSVAYATVMAVEAAAAAAHAAAEAVRLTSASRFLGKSKEEIAAIKIQTAYRGYLARRALRHLRGLGRLKSLIQGQSVKRQAASALRCMQTLARVQSQVRARRIRMSEENQALQRQLLQRNKKELDNARSSLGSTWDLSTKSKEQVEASLQSTKEAAERREKALAYAYSRQQTWRNSSKSANPTFMDPNNPHWRWSWLERWMVARPWETQSTTNRQSVGDTGRRLSCPPSRQSPSTPPSKAPSSVSGRRVSSASSKGSTDDDSKSLYSLQSKRNNKSLTSSPMARSYTGSTKSTKARSRMSNPGPSPLGSGKKGTPDMGSRVGSTKKQLSFSGSPSSGGRRSSGPLRTNSNAIW